MTDKKPIDKMIELSEDLGLYKEQIIIDGVDVSGCKYYLHNLHKSRCYNALEEIRKIIASTDVRTRPKLYDFEQDNKILDIISKVRMP